MSSPRDGSLLSNETDTRSVGTAADPNTEWDVHRVWTPTTYPFYRAHRPDATTHLGEHEDDGDPSRRQYYSPPPSFFLVPPMAYDHTAGHDRGHCSHCGLRHHRASGCWYIWGVNQGPPKHSPQKEQAFRWFLKQARERN